MLVSCWAFMFFYGSKHKEETCEKYRVMFPLFHTHQAAAGEWTYVFIVIFSQDMPVVTAKNKKTLCKHKVASNWMLDLPHTAIVGVHAGERGEQMSRRCIQLV